MYTLAIFGLLAALALGAPTALTRPGANIATVVSRCNFPVYLWSIAGGPVTSADNQMVTLSPHDATTGASSVYSETLHQSVDGSGISIKIALENDLSKVLGDQIEQLQYSLNPTMNMVFYDLSEINGGPFAAKGQKVELSAGQGCPVVHSDIAYHHPDDLATKACQLPSNLILTLCAC